MKDKLKVWSKKWWFWAIIVFIVICMFIPTDEKAKYEIVGEQLGKYGTEITLNANTDMPVKKYLYKLPAGSYTVTTTYDKMATFFIVKDKITIEEGNDKYPEILDYVSEGYLLTAGDNDFNGTAKKSVDIELKADESIQTVGTATYIFTEK